MLTFAGLFGKCILLFVVSLNVVHSGADASLYVFGFFVRMKDVQYAWIVGISALSGEPDVPKMDPTSAVCVTPSPFLALVEERTSQLD